VAVTVSAGNRVRRWLRSWLGVDQIADRVDSHDQVLHRQGRSLGALRRDLVAVHRLSSMRTELARLREADRPYTADQRRAAVDRAIGKDTP
jgi:hypothetical protein